MIQIAKGCPYCGETLLLAKARKEYYCNYCGRLIRGGAAGGEQVLISRAEHQRMMAGMVRAESRGRGEKRIQARWMTALTVLAAVLCAGLLLLLLFL